MSLLRRGSSKISEENFNCRLHREHAKAGAVTASLAWNDPTDLDLHASVVESSGTAHHIYYSNTKAGGGHLDVDMHANEDKIVEEPVENIFWKKPPAGDYSIRAIMFKKRGPRDSVAFHARLQREGEETLSVEGVATAQTQNVECFRFKVDADGTVEMLKVGDPMPAAAPVVGWPRAMRPMRAGRSTSLAAGKAKAKAKAQAAAAKAKARIKAALAKAKARAKAKAARAKAKGKAVMKKLKVSKIAVGKKAALEVFKGKKLKTKKGLKKEDLKKSKGNKVVSIRKSEAGKQSKWAKAVAKARTEKGYTGFKSLKKGGSFYAKAKEILGQPAEV